MSDDERRQFVQHLRAVRTSPQSFAKSIRVDSAPESKRAKKSAEPKIDTAKLANEYGL